MKTKLLFISLVIISLNLSAQCAENTANFGNNTSTPSYNISGDVSVILNTNNSISVNFANNFSTASGPDVRLYLIKSEGKSISELKNLNPTALENISFGLIGFSGSQSYTEAIPNNIDITQYDTVFFYCLQFNAFWDLGKFDSFNSTTCSVLSTDRNQLNTFKIFPNPAKNRIHLKNIEANSAEIRIFNVLGKQVYHQPKIIEKTIDISTFHKGIYLVKINIDGKSQTQKLVIN